MSFAPDVLSAQCGDLATAGIGPSRLDNERVPGSYAQLGLGIPEVETRCDELA
jgi:hypothetical protein